MENRRAILFPVEIINRELDYRILLACICAKDNNRIYIGQHDAIYRLARCVRRGIYVGKHIFRTLWPSTTLERYDLIKKNGFILVHLDEEGAVFDGLEEEWKANLDARLDPRCLRSEDFICTWGDFQNNYYKSLGPACKDNIYTTGYPKLDLYKEPYGGYYRDTSEKIKERYGDFILFNTNFTYANFGLGVEGIFSHIMNYRPDDEKRRTKYIRNWVYDNNTYLEFIKLINRLSIEYPDVNIVIRPHPGEDQKTYKAMFKGIKNIHVVHEGSVIPWLQACRLMIHNGCTTAIEAHFLNTQIITFKPMSNPESNYFLPNLVGIVCASEDEVLEKVGIMLRPETNSFAYSLVPAAYDLISNFGSDRGLPKLVEIISMADQKLGSAGSDHDAFQYRFMESLYGLYDNLKKVVRPLFREKTKMYKFYVNPNMFVPFDPSDIERRVRRAEDIMNVKVDVKFLNKELFSVTRRRA